MTDSVTLYGVTFAATDFLDYGHVQPVVVNGTSYTRWVGMWVAGLLELGSIRDAAQAAGNTFKWTFDASTSMTAPATGGVRLNNAAVGSVTAIALSAQTSDTGNPNIRTYELTWDDLGGSSDRGRLIIRKVGAPSTFAIYKLTGTITDNTSWVQLAVTHITSNGTWSDGDGFVMQFLAAGVPGADYTSNAALNAVGALTPAADKLAYFTNGTTAALATLTAFIRTLLDDADAATARDTLGITPLTLFNFTDVAVDTAMTANTAYRVTSNKTMTCPTYTAGQWNVVMMDTTTGNGVVARNAQTLASLAEDMTINISEHNKNIFLLHCNTVGNIRVFRLGVMA